MPAKIDLAKFTFDGEQIQMIKELTYEGILKSVELALFLTVYPGIEFKKEVGFVGKGGLLGKAGQGCDPVAQSWSLGTRKVVWEPAPWEVFIKECYKDLEGTIAAYSLKSGVQRPDFTSSDYMSIVVDFLIEGIKDMIIRVGFFGDTEADTFANGGTLTNGTDKDYFNWLDGFFKQITVAYTANADQRVAIAENAGATYAAQKLLKANMQGYMEALTNQASPLLLQLPGNIIVCTRSYYNAYKNSLQGTAISELYVNLVTGIKTLSYDGYPMFPIDLLDIIIKAYYNNGTKLVNPHRAIFTNPGILAVGVDDENSFSEIDTWYDKTTRNVYSLAMGKMDVKLANPELVQIAI